MSVFRISKLILHMRKQCHEPSTDMFLQRVCRVPVRQKFSGKYETNGTTTQSELSPSGTLIHRWKWTIFFGIGVSILAVWQKRKQHVTPTDDQRPITNLITKFYCCLPLKLMSRVWGRIASIEISSDFEKKIFFTFFVEAYRIKLSELSSDLMEFRSISDLFSRPLKPEMRPIAQNTNMVSPCDGRIVHCGRVTSRRVEQVKGVTYDLRYFLGDRISSPSSQSEEFAGENDDSYIKTLLTDPNNELYQVVIYLAPSDYHRFHSPTDWQIETRRHFQGELLSVRPLIIKYLPDLFTLNERVVYLGKWDGGFMAYTAVGATNVGSIKVYSDKELHTNRSHWPAPTNRLDADLGGLSIGKGDPFGEFRFGSTVVLHFEAPRDFEFTICDGQKICVGEALAPSSTKDPSEE